MAQESFSDQIRRAIDSSGHSRYSICKHIKVDQSTMSRFMNGGGGLSMDVLDRLADPRDRTLRANEAKPLTEHLADFRDSLLAKGNTREHVLVTFRRAGRVLDLAGVGRVSELSLSKALGALPSLRDAGMSQETVN